MLRIFFILLVIAMGVSTMSCRHSERDTKIEIQLNSPWEFREIGNNTWYAANVPGSVASDIEEIKKQGKSLNFKIQDIHKANWEYHTKFDVDQNIIDQDVVQLSFKGLETPAEVLLNDSLILKVISTHQSYIVNCKSVLKAKDNVLVIRFHQNLKRKRDSLNHRNHIKDKEDNYSYNHFCSGDAENNHLASIGIFKPIYLYAWSTAKISDVFLRLDSISPKRAVYTSEVTIQSIGNQNINLEYYVNNKLATSSVDVKLLRGENRLQTKIFIDKPKLWWVNGLGDQNMYKLTVRMKREQDIIYEEEQRFGVRTIELVGKTEKDGYFKLNGVPIFVKGESYVSSKTVNHSLESKKQIIESAKQSNLNLIRITGDIEDESFYDLCDDNGILVWQDIIACKAGLVKDSDYIQGFKQEVIENSRVLRNHPCLALWFGSVMSCFNDNCKLTDKEKVNEANKKLFKAELPELFKRYGSENNFLSYLSINENNKFKDMNPFSNQSIGNLAIGNSLPSFGYLDKGEKTISIDIIRDQDEMNKLWDNSSENKNILSSYVQNNFNKPKDFESEVYTLWIAQSEMLKSMIENARVTAPRCMGLIFNQLNEFQGKKSLATMDSSGWWKPAQYAVSDAFTHILVAPTRERDVVKIYVVSEALKDMDAILLVRLIDFNGNDLYVKQIPIEIKANTSNSLLSIKESELLRKADRTKCCLVVQVNQASKTLSQNILYFSELKNLYQPKASISFDINEAAKGYNLILRSAVLVKNLVISTDDKKCWFSDNNVDLLPEKRTKINIRYRGTKAQLEKSLHFWSLADLN